MKLNLHFNSLGIDGKELPDANAGNIIAQALANDTDGDCLKYWEWALKLNKGESIDLDINPGIYILTIRSDSGIYTQKIVKLSNN